MNRAAPIPRSRPTRQICILGMHRSGTSCLAGSLGQAGVFLGAVDQKAPFNKKGNKENLALRQINEDLLKLNHGSWDDLPASITWTAELVSRRNAFVAEYDSVQLWGFKDPRCLATLPFWREALPDSRFVGTFRHPVAVARSLLSRPGILPNVPPLQTWNDYNYRLLNVCRTEPVPLVCFDWPEAVYLKALCIVKQELGLQSNPAENPFFDARLVTFDKNRVQHDAALGPVDLLDEAMQLYRQLHDLAVDVSRHTCAADTVSPAPVDAI